MLTGTETKVGKYTEATNEPGWKNIGFIEGVIL